LVNLKKNFNENIEINIHSISFKKIKRNLKKKFPNLKVELFLISLDKKVRKY
jgi:carbonic anhydrase